MAVTPLELIRLTLNANLGKTVVLSLENMGTEAPPVLALEGVLKIDSRHPSTRYAVGDTLLSLDVLPEGTTCTETELRADGGGVVWIHFGESENEGLALMVGGDDFEIGGAWRPLDKDAES
jgi:hypothetical protein